MKQRGRRKAPRFSERDAVALFEKVFETKSRRRARVGIGDDAAVLDAIGGPLVWTVDASIEGTHFERIWLSLEDVGYRSFHAAASDLAAMGARPLAALSALELPPGFSAKDLAALAKGQALAARECGTVVVGGNVSRAPALGVTTTLIGTANEPLERTGAAPGDQVWLVGDVGLAACGLAWLRSRPRRPLAASAALCVRAFRRPRALIAQGMRLVGRAHAAIDVSDGLVGDLSRLAEASAVKAVLERKALERALRPELVDASSRVGRPALDWALFGGEDYALVATGPAARRPSFARGIGRIERGRGVVLEDEAGKTRPVRGGFDHLT
jgi:thiamine-monophosphate kinase